jgi:hypothetical protein
MSEWIEWNGGECPLPDGTPHQVRFKNGSTSHVGNGPNGWEWKGGVQYKITAYRVLGPTPQTLAEVTAQRDKLLDVLQELIDIEGPQPGTAAWASKVRKAIAECSK